MQLERSKAAADAARRVATDAGLVHQQELARAAQLEAASQQAFSTWRAAEARVDATPLGRASLSRLQLAALAGQKVDCERAAASAALQRGVADREGLVVQHAEHAAQQAARQRAQLGDESTLFESTLVEAASASHSAAKEKFAREQRGAASRVKDHRGRLLALEATRNGDFDQREKESEAAVSGQRKAVLRLAVSAKATAALRKECAKLAEDERAERFEAVLQLKADTEAASAVLKAKNERASKRRAAMEESFQKEKQSLEQRGENPYEVFRQRAMDLEAAKATRDALARIDAKRRAVVARIAGDAAREKKAAVLESQHVRMAKAHRDAQGREFSEKATTAYLVSRTGKQLVQTSGGAGELFASAVTKNVLDHTFGTGVAARQTSEQRAHLVNGLAHDTYSDTTDVGEYSQGLAKRKLALVAQKDAGLQQHSAGSGAAAVLALESLLPAKDTPDAAIVAAQAVKRLATRELSKFERDCRARAQQRQKDRLNAGAPQVIAGKTLTTTAFVAEPPVVLFEDFALGQRHHFQLKLTNVSLSFNSFKVLPLTDSHVDFFEVTYVKPGRMSAGTFCIIDIGFSPAVDQDISTDLHFLAETGPFSVPIRCSTKRVVPTLSCERVSFDGVVMGESKTFALVISNNGALPTEYEILDAAPLALCDASASGAAPAPAAAEAADDGGADGAADGAADDADAVADGAALDGADAQSDLRSGSAAGGSRGTEEAPTEYGLLQNAKRVGTSNLEHGPGLNALQFVSKGAVAPYSTTTHLIKFAPLAAQVVRKQLVFKFSNCDHALDLSVFAASVALPVAVMEEIVDFKTCVFGKLYRKTVLFRNHSANAVTAVAKPHACLRGCLEYAPAVGFLQPGQDFSMSVKFRPNAALIAACGPYALHDGSGIIAIPMRVDVRGQALPLYYTLRAQLTDGAIVVDPPFLDFGNVYVTESATRTLTLRNASALPTKYGFVHLRREVAVSPDAGFGVLIPFETKTVQVTFSPQSATGAAFDVLLKTTMCATYIIPISGTGLDAPLKLSHTCLKMAPVAPGGDVVASLFVENFGSEETAFEIAVPDYSTAHLIVQPSIASINPGETVRVEVTFRPPRSVGPANVPPLRTALPTGHDLTAAAAETDHDAGGSADDGGGAADDGGSADVAVSRPADVAVGVVEHSKHGFADLQGYADVAETDVAEAAAPGDAAGAAAAPGRGAFRREPWSAHGTWSLPIYVRGIPQPMSLQVETTVVERALWCDAAVLDFGQLAVGQNATLPLQLRSLQERALEVALEPALNGAGPFSVLNALRTVQKERGHTALVRFQPMHNGHSNEILSFWCRSLGQHVKVRLVGQGVSPSLSVEPASLLLDLGHCCAGHQVKQNFVLKNASVFALAYKLVPLGDASPFANVDGTQSFVCTPTEAVIPAGGERVVSVLFRPDCAREWPFFKRIAVDVADAAARKVLTFVGRCDAGQLFLERRHFAVLPPRGLEDPFTPRGTTPRVKVKFERYSKEPAVLHVGCAAQSGPDASPYADKRAAMAASGTFEIEFDGSPDSKRFSATPASGTVAAGNSTPVNFDFAAPEADNAGGLDVGRWVRTVAKVHLRGSPEARVALVDLEGYLPNLD
ncbi:hypothetical protein M885DRAFT_554868 [Pelagophyceae sp. CCMP2097]|nr:hypothetical protein M885DRAFT_554868 [Pelagophyceae sp. CCMP2097]